MAPEILPNSFYEELRLEASVVAEIQNLIQGGREPSEALRLAHSSTDLDNHGRERLLLCGEIVDICDGNIPACVVLFRDSGVNSIADVGVKYYCAGNETVSTDAIRSNLFFRMPTAVLYAVTSSGILKLPADTESTVTVLLETAVQDGFDMRSGSLGHFLAQPGCQAELSRLTADGARCAQKLLEDLCRLHSLVVDAEDLQHLVGTRFTSAHIIATTNHDDFVEEMARSGLVLGKSSKIHLEASSIDQRNELLWQDIIRSRKEVPVLAITGRPADYEPPPDTVNPNLSTLFEDLDSVETDDNSSVLSPASYLVDLLQLLKTVELKTPGEIRIDGAETALDVLFHRRPDIPLIELSAANTDTPTAYIDLAIEVMEKYLEAIVNPSTRAAQPKQDIYVLIGRQLAPMAIFPYNNAIATSRELLQARGYSRYELLRRFQSDADLARRVATDETSSSPKLLAAAHETHHRRLALEILGLQPLDFQAITQEAYHTRSLFRVLQTQDADLAAKSYPEAIGLRTPGEYWGFEADSSSSAEAKMLDALKLFKNEVLERTGLSPARFNAMLKTRYIGNRLVLTLDRGDNVFSDRLQDVRLQESLLITEDGEAVGQLSERTCLDIQAFLRLSHRLRWSIEALDAAVVTLASRSRLYKREDVLHYVLDGDFIERLAIATQLSEELGAPVAELLPFWGAMDAGTSSSLYTRLFLKSNLLRRFPSLGLVDGDGKPGITFGQNLAATLEVLQMTQADHAILMGVQGFGFKTPWTLENVARLYSHQKLCEILGLPIQRYPEWWAIVSAQSNPFLDPQSTRTTLEPWIRSTNGGGSNTFESVEVMLDLLSALPQEDLLDISPADLAVISNVLVELSAIEGWVRSLDAELPEIVAAQTYTRELLQQLCGRVLGLASTDVILDIIESDDNHETPAAESGIRVFSQRFGVPESKITDIIEKPVPKDDPNGAEEILRSRRRSLALLMLPALNRRAQVDVVQNAIAARFSDADPALLQTLLTGPMPHTILPVQKTCLEYFKGLLTSVREWMKTPKQGSVYFFPPTTTGYHFSTNQAQGNIFINDRALQLAGDVGKRRVTELQSSLRQGDAVILRVGGGLTLHEVAYLNESGEASFSDSEVCPPRLAAEVGAVLAHFQKSLEAASSLKLDAAELVFHRDWGINLAELDPSKLNRLLSYTHARDLYKAPASAIIRYSQFLDRLLSEQESVGGGNRSSEADAQAELVEETRILTKLSSDEITTFFNKESPSGSVKDRANWLADLGPLHRLADCSDMSKKLAVPIETLYRWASCPVSLTEAEGFDVLDGLEAALSSAAPNAILLAKESLRAKQRVTLQEYLLHTEDFRAKGITTADDISAELLIDVQMGPTEQTSRIAQAIASVQTFVQRSLLGLEKRYCIPTNGIDQSRWTWMCKFTLWQASRKVFLYPENWLDPSLRDDKSQAFKDMESKIMQVNLNEESVAQFLREYVYAAHEVADLQVLSYLWEGTKGFRGSFHFFGRTRTAPFIFYHRRLKVTGASPASARWNWLPWTKMEVDIMTHDVNADNVTSNHPSALLRAEAAGNRGEQAQPGSYLLPALFKSRLFLFIPQITRQALPGGTGLKPGTSIEKAAKDENGPPTPEECWEIKMAWTEMRNGNWSSKYVTGTGILVKQTAPTSVDGKFVTRGALPSISDFRFRLDLRSYDTKAPGDVEQVLQVHADLWKPSSDKNPTGPGIFLHLGSFELQGPRVRLVDARGGSPVGTSTDVQLEFGRMAYETDAATGTRLVEEVKKVRTGIEASRKSLLAAPDPSGLVEGTKYELSWALSYDTAHPYGASGLIVERATPSETQSFFGFPSFDVDGSGKYDMTQTTTVMTAALTHTAWLRLVEEIADKEGYCGIFDALEGTPDNLKAIAFGKDGNTYSELYEPGSLYNWELGFHSISLLMERLLATQQFELALQVARLVFNPARDDTASPADDPPDNTDSRPLSRLDRCWRFPPFKWHKVRLAGSVRDIIQRLGPGQSTSAKIAQWQEAPFSPHVVARGRPAVYMKRFVMKYIEILVASGDSYFRQQSRDAVPMATQRYVEASELFGPAPEVMDTFAKPVNKTYTEIGHVVNDFATASVDLELVFPYFVNPLARGQIPNPKPETRDSTLGFVRSTYFGVPPNPGVQTLKNLVDDRLYKIRNGFDINGNPWRPPLFDDPVDPGQLAAAMHGAGGDLSLLSSLAGGGSQGPMPNYRARLLLGRASALVLELRKFSDSYLVIKEKRDADAMSRLRESHEAVILAITAEAKQHTVQEATLEAEALEETRKGHVSQLRHYLELIGESADEFVSTIAPDPEDKWQWEDLRQDFGVVTKDDLRMSEEEVLEMDLTEGAMKTSAVATALDDAAAVLVALPKVTTQTQPMGVGASIQIDASTVAKSMLVGAGVFRAHALAASEKAARAGRKAQMVRQLQERRLAANAAGRELMVTGRRLLAARKRIEAAQLELKAVQQQVADVRETEAFLRTRYTSDRLYSWLEVETRRLAYQAYTAAFDTARLAERALTFEYGPRAQSGLTPGPGSFLAGSYWDESSDGLLAGPNLMAAIQRMEDFVIHNTPHDASLTKVISLRQVDPSALLRLRFHGVAEFALPEVLFDHDFPGHYCRRIKSVSLSIPAVRAPPVGVNCTLQLLEHRYRLRPGAASTTPTASYYRVDRAGDDRFHTDRVPITGVALGTGDQDSGALTLDFADDERYLPFEGAGVISRWKLEFPAPYPQFDYRSISDVLMTVRYTSLNGGPLWQKEATEAVRKYRSEAGASDDFSDQYQGWSHGAYILVDLPVEFAEEWQAFKTRLAAADKNSEEPVSMDLKRLPDLLPFWSPRHATSVAGVSVAIQPAVGDGWAGDSGGEVKTLGRVLSEQVESSAQFRVYGSAADESSRRIDDMDLSLSVAPGVLKGKAPQNIWVVVHFTRAE